MPHTSPDGERRRSRRRLLFACVGGVASLAGCATPEPRSNEGGGRLVVEVTSEVRRPVEVRVALIEGDESFERAVIASYTLGAAGDVARSTHDDVRGGPFRLVVRGAEGDELDEFETIWDLAECVEFGLYPTIREREIAVTTGCTHPSERSFARSSDPRDAE